MDQGFPATGLCLACLPAASAQAPGARSARRRAHNAESDPQAASMDGRLKLRRRPRVRTSACEQPLGVRLLDLLRCAADLPDAQYCVQSLHGDSSTCTDSTCRAGDCQARCTPQSCMRTHSRCAGAGGCHVPTLEQKAICQGNLAGQHAGTRRKRDRQPAQQPGLLTPTRP